jgi:hypothetical protein
VRSPAMFGMIESGDQLDLAQKAFGEVGSGVDIGQENFHGLDAVRNQIADLEDLAHAAAPEQRKDFVITYGLADFELGRRHTSNVRAYCKAAAKS